MFIKLTLVNDDPIWVNVYSIITIERLGEGSMINVRRSRDTQQLVVKEVPDKIIYIMAENNEKIFRPYWGGR